MLAYPNINPIALSAGPIKVHWYGIMYLIGFVAAWGLASLRARKSSFWNGDTISDLIFYGALGVIIGGRLGDMLIFDYQSFFQNPLNLFKVWQGGMSFHGGLIGVMLALVYFAYKYKKPLFEITDFVMPLVPIGLGLGRIGNFINGELWGRVTDVPWAMVFPQAGILPRHPSQLYEAFLEGLVLFLMLWFYTAKPKPRMAATGLFLLGYGAFRFLVEFVRHPDPPYGLILNTFTMSQFLCVPMIILGTGLMIYAYRYNKDRLSCNSI